MKSKNKDPLRPKEDVRINKKDGDGFLKTLTKVVKKKPKSEEE